MIRSSSRSDRAGHVDLQSRSPASMTVQPGRIVPGLGKLHNGSRSRNLFGTTQSALENFCLVFPVKRLAGCVPQGVVHKKTPGWFYESGEVVG